MITATGEKDAADHTFGSGASIRLCRLRPVYPLTVNAPTSVGDDWYGPRACKNSILSHTTWAITGPLEHLRLRPTISSGSCLHRPPSHGHELRALRIGGTVNFVVAKPGPAGAIKQRGPGSREMPRSENARGSSGPRRACPRRCFRPAPWAQDADHRLLPSM